ncbi:MAG: V4R domain-containing protein [Halobacteriota archaeon]|nr:V4R domain-containing protein [Halobacteriota archaeon]
MEGSEIDNRIFEVYKDYAIYHPDLIIVNRKISRSIIGPISSTVEYNIGKRIGEMIVGECRKLFEGYLLKISFEIVEKSGWGKINIDDSRKIVRVHNSLVSKYYIKHEGISHEAIDDIMRGIIGAIFEAVEERVCKIKETKCIAKGDDYCEFIIE